MKALHLLAAAAGVITSAVVSAQTTIGWNFGTGTASLLASSGAPVDNLTIGSIGSFTGQTLTTNLTSPSSGYTGASGNMSGSFAAVAGVFNVSSSSAFTITLTPAAGHQVSITSLSLGSRSTGSGPTTLALRTSADGFASDAFSTSVSTGGTWALIQTGALSNINGTSSDPLTIRIYGYGGTSASAGNWRLDDVSMTVSMSAVPEPSTYAAISGAAALLGALWHRRRRQGPPVAESVVASTR